MKALIFITAAFLAGCGQDVQEEEFVPEWECVRLCWQAADWASGCAPEFKIRYRPLDVWECIQLTAGVGERVCGVAASCYEEMKISGRCPVEHADGVDGWTPEFWSRWDCPAGDPWR